MPILSIRLHNCFNKLVLVTDICRLLLVLSTLAPATTASALPTDSVYLWLPLVVVLIFTIIMVTLILMGRHSDTNNNTINRPGENLEISTL